MYRILLLIILSASISVSAQQGITAEFLKQELRETGAQWEADEENFFALKLPNAATDLATFLKNNGPAFGLSPADNLKETSRSSALDGRTYLRLLQEHDGVPVLGGDIVVQLSNSNQPRYISGHIVSFPQRTPSGQSLSSSILASEAKAAIVADHPFANQWNITDHGDIWTRRNPWTASDNDPYRRCRALEVWEPGGSLGEMVYVDLINGKAIFQHSLHCDLQRQLYYRNTASSNIIWQEDDLFPGMLADADKEMLAATEEIYSLYFRTFGRNGHDGNGTNMRVVNQAAISGCPNARAFRNIVLACEGVVGDDIVGHEWTHNYTTEMNGLLLKYESGSIQEGMADIFGEAVDLLNDRGIDDNDQMHRNSCFEGNYRWNIAEDATAIDTILRDMWSPECKTDPADRDSDNYVCNDALNQNIHTNSTIVTRTFALLTDGDTTATYSIAGIDLTKALHIFYHANANYITPVTDFQALATALKQSARDLQGTNLPALTLVNTLTQASNQFITDADLISLDSAIAITQMDIPSPCPYLPTLAQSPSTGCEDSPINNFVSIFSENWEDGIEDWQIAENPVFPNSWDPKAWELTTNLPDERQGQAIFAPNSHVGDCQTDLDNGTVDLTSPIINLPAGQQDFTLRFTHYYSIEEETDGGRMAFSLNGEEFLPVSQQAFLYNGYDKVLLASFENDNPLAGQYAFTGADRNSTTGSWGTSVVDLSVLGAEPGDNLQIRWTLGHDGCDGWLGWYIDEVEVGYCGDATLPVEYLSFTAAPDKGKIVLDWETLLEEENAGFHVERQSLAGQFQTIGFVSAGANSYQFTDNNVVGGTTYFYRLRQVDLDGTANYSGLVSAVSPEGTSLMIFPNPSDGAFSIRGNQDATQATIFDLNGRKITLIPLQGGRGQVDGLKRGIYVVRVGEMICRAVVR
jgi:bacillolysin